MVAARKTRAQCNAERVVLRKSRRVPRVTKGYFTFEKAIVEVKHRHFVVEDGAKAYWSEQICSPRKRKIRIMHHGRPKDVPLNNILNGITMSSKPTAKAKKVSNAKRSATRKALDLGQTSWMEAAGIKAAMKVMDPQGLLEVCLLPDSLRADFLLRPANSTDDVWVPVQMKTAEAYDGEVNLSIKKEDGLAGGIYENMIIIGAVVKVDRKAARKTMTVFGAIPGAEVTELFLYRSASDIPGPSLRPCPRRKRDDKYGDHRFVMGFDEPQRLETMQTEMVHLVHTMPKVTYEDACCSFGPGTLNVRLSETHKEEVLNMKALAHIVGMESLRAPALQNFTTDIIWQIEGVGINISLKSAVVNNGGRCGGYYFFLGAAPYAEHCRVAMAFYREGTVRTHVSVICARRVYVADRANFCWSPTHTRNADVWEDRIDLRHPDALEKLTMAVSSFLA